MPTPIEKLVFFIHRRRKVLGLGHNALARAAGLDPGTLANLMVGRIKNAPSLATMQKLAAGLQCDPQVLIAIVSGYVDDLDGLAEAPEDWETILAGPMSRSRRGKHPLTPAERQVLAEAEQVGLRWAIGEFPEFLDIPPSDRNWMFQELERILHSVDIHRQLAALDRPS